MADDNLDTMHGPEVQSLFIALAAIQNRTREDPYNPLNVPEIARLMEFMYGPESRFAQEREVVRVLDHLEHSRGVRNLADYLDWRRQENDDDYRNQVLALGNSRTAFAIVRRDNRDEIVWEPNPNKFRAYINRAMQHVHRETLLSEEMGRRLQYQLSGFNIGYREFVEDVIVDAPNGMIGQFAPRYRPDLSPDERLELELNHMERVLEFFGETEDDPNDRFVGEQYVLDLERMAALVSFQTLASELCYEYLGERFKYYSDIDHSIEDFVEDGPDPVRRRLEDHRNLELFWHIRMVSDAMMRLDPIEMARIKQMHVNECENYYIRRSEMILAKLRIGEKFHRFRVIPGENIQVGCGLMTIFHAIRFDAPTCIDGKTPSLKRVIKNLQRNGNITTERNWKDWRRDFVNELHYCPRQPRSLFNFDIFFNTAIPGLEQDDTLVDKVLEYVTEAIH